MKNFKALLTLVVLITGYFWVSSEEQAVRNPTAKKEVFLEDLGYDRDTAPRRSAISQIEQTVLAKNAAVTNSVKTFKKTKKVKGPKRITLKDLKKKKKKKTAKKKTKKKKAPTVAEKVETKKETKKLSDRDEQSQPTNNVVADAPAPAAFAPQETNKELKTIEEWLDFLGSRPGLSKIDQLLKTYRKGDVSKSVYYGVARELLESRSEKNHFMAIRLIGAVQEVESFVALAEVVSSNLSDKVRGSARQYLNIYRDIKHIKVLTRVLNLGETSSIAAEIAALSKIKQATTQATRTGELTLLTDSQGTFTNESARELVNLVNILSTQIQSEQDADLRRRKSDLLVNLQSILTTRV